MSFQRTRTTIPSTRYQRPRTDRLWPFAGPFVRSGSPGGTAARECARSVHHTILATLRVTSVQWIWVAMQRAWKRQVEAGSGGGATITQGWYAGSSPAGWRDRPLDAETGLGFLRVTQRGTQG
jgi:hypothetical protein